MAENKTLQILLTAKDEASKVLKNFDGALASTGKTLQNAGAFLGKVALGIGAVGAVAGTAGAGLFAFANKTSQTADRVDKMSQSLGMTKKGFQELDYVLGQNGVNIDNLGTAIKTVTKLTSDYMDGMSGAPEIFDEFGINVKNTSGELKSQEDIFKELVSKFQEMPTGVEKSQLAFETFGKTSQDLMPLLNQQSGSMEELIKQANDLGIVMSDTAVNNGVIFGDTLDAIKKSLGAVATEIGGEVMTKLQTFLNWVLENMPQIKAKIKEVYDSIKEKIDDTIESIKNLTKFFKEHWNVIQPILVVIGAGAVTFGIYTLAINASAIATGIWTTVTQIATIVGGAFGTVLAFITSPIGLVVLGITALVTVTMLLIKNWDAVKNKTREVWEDIKNTIESIVSNISKSFDNFKNKIRDTFDNIKTFIQPVIDLISSVISKIDKIKSGISSAVGGAISSIGNVFGGGKASGGSVYSNRAYTVGENGREMFIPNQNGTIIPNKNLGGGSTINITVTGNQLLDDRAGDKIGEMIINKLKYQANLN